MSSLRPDILINPADLFIQTAPTSGTVPYMTQIPDLGVRSTTGDGREYRFVSAGASALIVGQLIQSAAPQANYIDVTAIAVAAGATTATLTVSTGTAVTANQFSGGYYMTYGTVANGGGQILKISSNTAVSASGTSITLTLEDAPSIAITTSATVNIFPPPYAAVIQTPSTVTGKPVGIALGVNPNTSTTLNGLTALYYGWLQIKGVANALIAGTPAIGTGLSAPNAGTAGALQVTAATLMDIATNLKTGTDGRYGPVDLLIS
jgi:hypothetical protein